MGTGKKCVLKKAKKKLLFFILVDKVREQVLEWASPFKYDLVPSSGAQDGHAALSHLLFLFI